MDNPEKDFCIFAIGFAGIGESAEVYALRIYTYTKLRKYNEVIFAADKR